jgi:predicted RNase H-like HicB family nuclease
MQKKPLLPELDDGVPVVSAFTAHKGYEYPDGACIKYCPDVRKWRAWWKAKAKPRSAGVLIHSMHRNEDGGVSYYKTAEEAANAFKGTGEGPDCPEWDYWGNADSTAKPGFRTINVQDMTEEQLKQWQADHKAWRATQPVLPLQIGDKILVECTYQGDHVAGRGMIGVHEATTCYPMTGMMVMSVPSTAIHAAAHMTKAPVVSRKFPIGTPNTDEQVICYFDGKWDCKTDHWEWMGESLNLPGVTARGRTTHEVEANMTNAFTEELAKYDRLEDVPFNGYQGKVGDHIILVPFPEKPPCAPSR